MTLAGKVSMVLRREAATLALGVAMATLYVGSVLAYTHGALLYSGDNTGYYTVYDFVSAGFPASIVQVIYALMSPYALIFLSLAAGMNYYIAYYFSLYLSAILTSLSISYLIRRMFPGLGRRQLAATGIATFLYYYNPNTYIAYYYGVNFVGLNFVYLIAFLATLYGLPRASRRALWRDSLLAGLLLGLGAGVFPNDIRLFLAGFILYVIFLVYKLLKGPRSAGVLPQVAAFVSAFAAGNAYTVLPMVANLTGALKQAYYGAFNLGGVAVRSEPWAAMIYTLRLLDSWTFNSEFNPSRYLLNQNPFLVISTFVWPVAALALPLLIHERRHRSTIALTAALMLVAMWWDAGPNPPLGSLYARVVAALPLGQQLFGYDFFAPLLAILFSVMISYVVVTMVGVCRSRALKLLGVAMLAGASIVSYPALAGYSVTAYFNPSVHGFWIPQEYVGAREYLLQHKGTALILPGDYVYMTTAWNLQDNMYWYNQFFMPARVLTIANFGGGYASSSERTDYTALVSRITIPDVNDTLPINYSYAGPPGVFRAGVSRNIGSVLSLYPTTNAFSEPPAVDFTFKEPLNLSRYEYLVLSIRTQNVSYFKWLMENQELQIGVYSYGIAGWYFVNSSVNSYAVVMGSDLLIFLRVGSPDTTWGGPLYNVSSVNGLSLQFPLAGNITISYPVIYACNATTVNPSWLSLLHSYNINYILLDRSIVSGNMTSYSYLSASLGELVADGYLRPVWSEGYLTIYEVD